VGRPAPRPGGEKKKEALKSDEAEGATVAAVAAGSKKEGNAPSKKNGASASGGGGGARVFAAGQEETGVGREALLVCLPSVRRVLPVSRYMEFYIMMSMGTNEPTSTKRETACRKTFVAFAFGRSLRPERCGAKATRSGEGPDLEGVRNTSSRTGERARGEALDTNTGARGC
jgi:hypothetical protein